MRMQKCRRVLSHAAASIMSCFSAGDDPVPRAERERETDVCNQVSYSDSPHCSDNLHPAAGPTHLQTANILQNSELSERVCCTLAQPD